MGPFMGAVGIRSSFDKPLTFLDLLSNVRVVSGRDSHLRGAEYEGLIDMGAVGIHSSFAKPLTFLDLLSHVRVVSGLGLTRADVSPEKR